MRDHLIAVEKQTGITPKQLKDAVDLPLDSAYLWWYFVELHRYRDNNGMSLCRITPRNIKDWCWLTGNELDLWEKRAIMMIDNVFLNSKNV